MTVARQVVAGRTYLLSRRCTQHQLLLRPDPQVEQIYLYCLGEAAERYGITLHGFIAMSNRGTAAALARRRPRLARDDAQVFGCRCVVRGKFGTPHPRLLTSLLAREKAGLFRVA